LKSNDNFCYDVIPHYHDDLNPSSNQSIWRK